MEPSVTLIIAGTSVLVGLLCLWLVLTALVRMRQAKKGKDVGGDTPASLRNFALKYLLGAVVMFAFAAVIWLYS